MHNWTATNGLFADELTVLFFAYIGIQDNQYKEKFSKDDEIQNLYTEYLKFSKKFIESEYFRLSWHEAEFNGDDDKVKEFGEKFMKSYGIPKNEWSDKF